MRRRCIQMKFQKIRETLRFVVFRKHTNTQEDLNEGEAEQEKTTVAMPPLGFEPRRLATIDLESITFAGFGQRGNKSLYF